jgi:hypothetical protein
MTNAELIAAVRSWAAESYPGCRLRYVNIYLRRVKVPIRLAAGPESAPVQMSSARPGQAVDNATRDILATLRAAARPLTKTLLLEAMAQRAHRGECEEWSQSTVERRLAELMEDGTIENPPDARPRGYRIADGDAK